MYCEVCQRVMKTAKPKTKTAPKLTATKAKAIGWKVLAGGFHASCDTDLLMAEGILQHIESTGGKAALVDAGYPIIEVWRPTAEMESIEQTEDRLKRLHLTSN